MSRGRHDSGEESQNRQRYLGKHREPTPTTEDPKNPGSFWVDSPERKARGVGDRQVGGRDD